MQCLHAVHILLLLQLQQRPTTPLQLKALRRVQHTFRKDAGLLYLRDSRQEKMALARRDAEEAILNEAEAIIEDYEDGKR